MILTEIFRAVDELSDAERKELRRYIDEGPKTTSLLTPEERTRRLHAALLAMGEGLNQAQLDEMTAAMTEKYIEPWDESEWTE